MLYVHYMPRIYLFYNWKFVPFDHLHPFNPSTTPIVFVFVFVFSFFFSWEKKVIDHSLKSAEGISSKEGH